MHGWDAGQYLRFADERTLPARDLVARIDLGAPRRIVDLGCGPGNSTAVLRERWPDAAITGLDSSAELLEAARQEIPASNLSGATSPNGHRPSPMIWSFRTRRCNGCRITSGCCRG